MIQLEVKISRLLRFITLGLYQPSGVLSYFEGLIDGDEDLYQNPKTNARTQTDTAVAVKTVTFCLLFDEKGDFGIIAIELMVIRKE